MNTVRCPRLVVHAIKPRDVRHERSNVLVFLGLRVKCGLKERGKEVIEGVLETRDLPNFLKYAINAWKLHHPAVITVIR